jgi:hypothetical protein
LISRSKFFAICESFFFINNKILFNKDFLHYLNLILVFIHSDKFFFLYIKFSGQIIYCNYLLFSCKLINNFIYQFDSDCYFSDLFFFNNQQFDNFFGEYKHILLNKFSRIFLNCKSIRRFVSMIFRRRSRFVLLKRLRTS